MENQGEDAKTPTVAAYLRIVPPGIKFPEASIGRVISTSEYRGHGIGQVLLEKAMSHLDHLYHGQAIRISAQAYLENFYRKFGFATISEMYLEDDIPHIEMLRT